MSLRPRQDFAGRVSIAASRMAPGGRRWSESPIPRVARRRVRQMGQPVLAPAALFAYSTLTPSDGFAGGVALMPESETDATALVGLTVQARLTVPAGVPTTGVSLTLRGMVGWTLADGPWAFPAPITPGQELVSPPHTWPDPWYDPDTGGIVVYWLECDPVGAWMDGWAPGNGLCEIRPTA